jgi:hypothetical protein
MEHDQTIGIGNIVCTWILQITKYLILIWVCSGRMTSRKKTLAWLSGNKLCFIVSIYFVSWWTMFLSSLLWFGALRGVYIKPDNSSEWYHALVMGTTITSSSPWHVHHTEFNIFVHYVKGITFHLNLKWTLTAYVIHMSWRVRSIIHGFSSCLCK